MIVWRRSRRPRMRVARRARSFSWHAGAAPPVAVAVAWPAPVLQLPGSRRDLRLQRRRGRLETRTAPPGRSAQVGRSVSGGVRGWRTRPRATRAIRASGPGSRCSCAWRGQRPGSSGARRYGARPRPRRRESASRTRACGASLRSPASATRCPSRTTTPSDRSTTGGPTACAARAGGCPRGWRRTTALRDASSEARSGVDERSRVADVAAGTWCSPGGIPRRARTSPRLSGRDSLHGS